MTRYAKYKLFRFLSAVALIIFIALLVWYLFRPTDELFISVVFFFITESFLYRCERQILFENLMAITINTANRVDPDILDGDDENEK